MEYNEWPERTFSDWLDEVPVTDDGGPIEGARPLRALLTDRERAIAMLAWDAARMK